MSAEDRFRNPGAGPSMLNLHGPYEAPSSAGGGGGGGVDSEEVLKEALLRNMFGRERGYAEVIENDCDPARVRNAQRMLSANMERLYYEDQSDQYSFIVQRMVMPNLFDRISNLELTKPLFMGWNKDEKEAGFDKDPKALEKMVEELKTTKSELLARQNLVARVNEERMYEGDVEEYSVTYFLRGMKQSMDSKHYGTIFNSKETYEGFKEYGDKVEQALGLWKRVAEGNAKIKVTDVNGKAYEKRLPNVFALPRNKGLFDLVIKQYITPSMVKLDVAKNERSDIKAKAIKKLEEDDCRSAAITSLLLMWHWDLDVEFGVGKNGYMSNIVSSEDLENLTHEIINDFGKVSYAEQRRASEWRGGPNKKDGMREHPRAAGSPSTLGCLPRLSRSALHVISTEVHAEKYVKNGRGEFVHSPTPKYEKDKKGKIINVDQSGNAVPEGGTPKVCKRPDGTIIYESPEIRVSIADAVWSEGKVRRAEKGNVVEWRFTQRKLKEILWDDIRLLSDGAEIKKIEPVLMADFLSESEITELKKLELVDFEMGTPTNAIEVPYKLQAFLAYNYLFKQFMRTDYAKQYEEVTKSDLLLKMNKGVDNTLGLLQTAYNLDQDLTTKLNSYLRVVFLAGLASSMATTSGLNAPSEGPLLENQAQVTPANNTGMDSLTISNSLLGAARVSRFLTTIVNPNKPSERKFEGKQEALFRHILSHRKAPTPTELVTLDGFADWFTKDELEILSAMYPLDINKKKD